MTSNCYIPEVFSLQKSSAAGCINSVPLQNAQDFYREKDPSLRSLSLKAFTGIIFQHCPGLTQLYKDRDAIYANFSAYKQTVPVMGAILLNVAMDKCLLVRGYKDSASWGFPKGKVAKEESDMACAIREVLLHPSCAWICALMQLDHNDLHNTPAVTTVARWCDGLPHAAWQLSRCL